MSALMNVKQQRNCMRDKCALLEKMKNLKIYIFETKKYSL